MYVYWVCFKPSSFCSISNIYIPFCIVSPEGSVQISPGEVLTSFNSNVTLTCNNEGGPNNMFDWRLNGVTISGANDPVLSISMVTGFDGGDYQCNVTNAAGSDDDTITITGR